MTFNSNLETILITTHVVKNSAFRYKDSVDEGLGIFQRNDADSILNVGYNTKNTKKIKMHLKANKLTEQKHLRNHYIYQSTLKYKNISTKWPL